MEPPSKPVSLSTKPLPGEELNLCAYVGSAEHMDKLILEVGQDHKRYENLVVCPQPEHQVYWAQNLWENLRLIRFATAREAASLLDSWPILWYPYGDAFSELASEIARHLGKHAAKNLSFPPNLAPQAQGFFMVLDAHSLLASTDTTNPFPGGRANFIQNKKDPPSSAYLKLWEALTRLGKLPQRGDRCLDAGACPGGWTWVLDSLGADVLALDRSPLDPRLMNKPNIRFRGGNAFAIKPSNLQEFGWDSLDWLVSDLICYPEKLLDWVFSWMNSGLVANFVITIKMQGTTDWQTVKHFASIPGSLVYHGAYNKNELTWIYAAPPTETNLAVPPSAPLSGMPSPENPP